MSLSFVHSPWLFLVILPLAALVSWWMYRQNRDLLPPAMRWGLMVFRFLVLVAIGALLLEPVLTSTERLRFAPVIAVLQDNSESLVVQRDSAFVRNEWPEKLQTFAEAFDPEDYTVEIWPYGAELEGQWGGDSLTFDRTATNLSEALDETVDRYRNQNLGAVVLISDGIPTAGSNPVYSLNRFRQPVYTVLLGDSTARRDIRIREVRFNEITYLGNEMPIKVRVDNQGYDQASLRVRILQNGQELAAENLKLSRTRTQGEVDFMLKPKEAGLQQYRVEVSRLDGELSYRNNRRSLFVNVIETRLRIALFAGAYHPDLGAIRKAFEGEQGIELESFVVESPGKFYPGSEPDDLASYDLIILHNYPQSSSDRRQIAKIQQAVEEEKVPVIYFLGKFTHLPTLQPLFLHMAIAPRELNPRSEEVIADFQPGYRQHSTYTFPETWLQWANQSPPIFRNQSDWVAKPDAEVFATAKIRNVPLDYPVFALRNYLSRKNMVFLGEGFWRMRAHAYLERGEFEWFDAWINNLVKWLIISDDKRKFRVEPVKRLFTGNDLVQFQGQVYDESYNPVPEVEIKLSITDPEGKEVEYFLNESTRARYSLEIGKLPEGTYRYQAEGTRENRLLGKDQGQFSVGRSNIEHFRLQADTDLMRQIAVRSGGGFYTAQQTEELVEELKSLPDLKPIIDYKRNRRPVFDYRWVMTLLLLLMGIEWIVRKWYSLR